jgi:aspartate carbamoyltransferase regulatory subunit
MVESYGQQNLLQHKWYCTNKKCMFNENKNYMGALYYIKRDNIDKYPFEYCEIKNMY